MLTEAVRRKPYSVVLLDEVEKAHPDVMELFYQVFDKGMLEDGEGREIDFKNTVILLTSNAGSNIMMKLCADPETRPDPEGIVVAIRPQLIKLFNPALLKRMVVVPYYPIVDDVMREIIKLQLGRVRDRLTANHGAAFTYEESVVDEVASRCKEVESGARNVDHILRVRFSRKCQGRSWRGWPPVSRFRARTLPSTPAEHSATMFRESEIEYETES